MSGLDGHTHYVTVGRRVPPTGPRLDPHAAAGRARALAGRRPDRDRRVHDRGELPRHTARSSTTASATARRPTRCGALLDLPTGPTSASRSPWTSTPTSPISRRFASTAGSCSTRGASPGTPDDYAAFVRGSKAELGIAKEGYVVSRCGWFGDRSAAYLASGRPVVAQDTGFGERLPIGAGLFAFADADDVLAAIEAIRFDYGRHARAARAIAEEHLDSRHRADPAAACGRRAAACPAPLDPRGDRRRAGGAARRDADCAGARSSTARALRWSSSRRTDGAAAQGSLAERADRAGTRREARLPARPASRDRGVPLAARRRRARHAGARRCGRRSGPRTGTGWWSRRWTGTELYQVGELERWQQVGAVARRGCTTGSRARATRGVPAPLRPLLLRALAGAGGGEPARLRSSGRPARRSADDARPRRAVCVERAASPASASASSTGSSPGSARAYSTWPL